MNNEREKEIILLCVYCKSSKFEVPHANYTPSHGELIRCANCQRLNDYSSLVRVAIEEARKYAVEMAKELAEEFKRELKKN